MGERMEQPLVSIVLPTYNRSALIRRSIQSVLCQTESRFELIVVDDASSDDTRTVVEAIDDPRVCYVRQETNRGPGAARNEGIRRARGSLVAFQDSDDEWLPEKLEKQVATLEAAGPGVGVVVCDMLRIHASGESSYHRTPDVVRGRLLSPRTGYYQTFAVGIQSALIRRELCGEIGGFDPEMRWFEDSELFLRLAQITEFRRLPEPLVRYFESGGLVADHRAEIGGRWRTLRRHLLPLLRESPAFVAREALLLSVKRLGGRLTINWRGRPFGPEPI